MKIPPWLQENFTCYRRLHTRPVKVGKLTIGSGNPIWLQSMANTDTMDTSATVEQIQRLADVGCDLARITVPNLNSARNLEVIKNRLRAAGYDIPLVADVHFTPQAATIAAEIVEKVRINPGNFVDRKHFKEEDYTEEQYRKELERVEEKFIPLLEICRKNKTALRIGSNHGSLSDRIVNRYGDGPEGMVQSALEFLDICEKVNFDQVVFSMKSSNTLVMVAAYRLLAHRFWERGSFYPIHLGVTEAGDDEDGRAKSALGIGSLLMDGIGDTIRVSLTEDPEKEIPVAHKIVESVRHLNAGRSSMEAGGEIPEEISSLLNPFDFSRAKTLPADTWGGPHPAQVMFSPQFRLEERSDLSRIGLRQLPLTEKWHSTHSPDFLFCSGRRSEIPLYATLLEAGQRVMVSASENPESADPLLYDSLDIFQKQNSLSGSVRRDLFKALRVSPSDLEAIVDHFREHPDGFSKTLLILGGGCLKTLKYLALSLKARGIHQPLALSMKDLTCPPGLSDPEARKVAQAVYAGYLLVDGLIDGVFMEEGSEEDLKYMFAVLQASRQRISKPEYISCPSCGRTLFDLQEVTAKVKAATHHLVGVKIAVMGCIVNGPGEMADADFGYVGSGPGKITLYRGKEIKVRNVQSENAVQELVNLIKREGYWKEPENEEMMVH